MWFTTRDHSRHLGRKAQPSPPRVGTDPTTRPMSDRSEGNRLPRVLRGITWCLVGHSVYRHAAKWYRPGVVGRRIARWELWNLPRQTLAWLLATELGVLVWAVAAAATDRVTGGSLVRFGVLLLCALAYLVATREFEERRRHADLRTEHVDQTLIWLFTAALALPVPLILVLVGVVRVFRYRIARKPWHRFLFTTSAIEASALGVHAIAAHTPLGAMFSGAGLPVHAPPATIATVVAGLAAAVAVYFLAQAVLIGVIRGLTTGRWSLTDLLGDRATNLFLLGTLGCAVLAALAQATVLPLELVMVPVAIRSTTVEQALRHRDVENARLAVDAGHDPLTGLPNRRYFDPEAALHLVKDANAGRPTALLFADLDHFKAWNTRLGHIGGDELLKAVATILRAHTRLGDVPCRWGGEEMAVMLPGTDAREAVRIAERIRLAVHDLRLTIALPAGGKPVQLNENGIPGLTVSIGVAVAPDHGTDLELLEQRADQALDHAKATGRNLVVIAPKDHRSDEVLSVAM
jgi:diguanylate cyclase (GGDEF)-like protein